MVSFHVVNGSWLTKSQYCMKQFCNAFVFASATIGNQTEHKFQIPLAAEPWDVKPTLFFYGTVVISQLYKLHHITPE